MTAIDSNVAAVLALVQGGEPEEAIEAELPAPAPGTSPSAQALHYALLREYEFSLGEMIIVEQLVAARSMLDEIEAAWRHDGAETTSLGSTGQLTTEPRIAEMRQIRQQIQSLVRSLNLPAEGDQQDKRRPGRPTRAQSSTAVRGSQWSYV